MTSSSFFRDMFPEFNLMLVVKTDDIVDSTERIPFSTVKGEKSDNQLCFYPFSKERDKNNNFTFLTKIKKEHHYTTKIGFKLCVYCNNKLVPISKTDLLLDLADLSQSYKYDYNLEFSASYSPKNSIGVLNLSLAAISSNEEIKIDKFINLPKTTHIRGENAVEFTYNDIPDICLVGDNQEIKDYLSLKQIPSQSLFEPTTVTPIQLANIISEFASGSYRYEIHQNFNLILENRIKLGEDCLSTVWDKITDLLEILSSKTKLQDNVFLINLINNLHLFLFLPKDKEISKLFQSKLESTRTVFLRHLVKFTTSNLPQSLIFAALCQINRLTEASNKADLNLLKEESVPENMLAIFVQSHIYQNFSLPFFELSYKLVATRTFSAHKMAV